MSCPQGLIVMDYSCGLLQRDNGDCTRGQPCPASGSCCESNPFAIGIIIACSVCGVICCSALVAFFFYKMCCASQSSEPSAGQPMQTQPQVVVVQQGAPVNPIQVDQFGNLLAQPVQLQPTPGQTDTPGNPFAHDPQANPSDEKNDATGYPAAPG